MEYIIYQFSYLIFNVLELLFKLMESNSWVFNYAHFWPKNFVFDTNFQFFDEKTLNQKFLVSEQILDFMINYFELCLIDLYW